MGQRIHRSLPAAALAIGLLIAAAAGRASPADRISLRSGVGLEYLSRTLSWNEGAGSSRLSAALITARGVVGLAPGIDLALSAGVALSNFNGLEFGGLPVSLEYESGYAAGLAFGAEARAVLCRSGSIEIQAAGRIVSSIGFSRTWPLEGFAVEGAAAGKPVWGQASAGPRLVVTSLGRFVPSVGVSAGWLWGRFRMSETLGELSGREDLAVKGRSVVEVSLGADYDLSPRFALEGRLGVLPYGGGADAGVSLGFLYAF